MRNPFKKKRKSTYIEIPLHIFARQVAFDTHLSTPAQLSDLLKFPPMSDDVAEMEFEASLERVNEIMSMQPVLSFHSMLIGDLSARFHQTVHDDIIPEEDIEELRDVYAAVALISTRSLLSVLNWYNLIHITGSGPRVIDKDLDEQL